MDHKPLFAALLALTLMAGCITVREPGGTLMAGVGNVTAEHCAKINEAGEGENCTKIEGKGFTEGFVKFLSDALMVIPRMLAGAAAGAATTQ